jgi:DNA-binding IclR family transcriptional regulator
VVRRLEPAIIEQLVHDYEAGVETTELTERYGLGKGTVLRLLRSHGATMRRQRLSPAEIDEATKLYSDGWSLARIGQQFGRAHTVIRKALLDRGVQLRPRNGWPPS